MILPQIFRGAALYRIAAAQLAFWRPSQNGQNRSVGRASESPDYAIPSRTDSRHATSNSATSRSLFGAGDIRIQTVRTLLK